MPEAIAAGAADKRRSRVMLGLVAAADRNPKIKQRMRKFVGELRQRMTPVLAAGGIVLLIGTIMLESGHVDREGAVFREPVSGLPLAVRPTGA